MVRLAIVISHPIQYHAPLYSFLARDGRFDLHVFYMSDRGARPYYDAFAKTTVRFDNPILAGYEYTFLQEGEPKGWWEKKTEQISARLPRELARFRPDAVYFHGYTNPSFWPAMRWCRRNGARVLLRGENEDWLPRTPWRNVARETFLRMLMPRVDAFLYIGKANRDFFVKRGVPDSKLFYVPYSVDNDYFRAGVSDEQLQAIRTSLRSRYGLDPDTRLFVYTHKFRDTMRPVDAAEAFARAAPAFTRPAALLMCGEGELRAELEAVTRANPQAKIILTGFLSQSDLREHLLGSDIMINPAIEPWGCTVNEGIASGLAQISSDMVVGWPDMVRQTNGMVYACGDIPALAEDIRTMSAIDDAELGKMQSESLRLATEELSFATCADGLFAAATAKPAASAL
jgi:glycosyltransferase involved in cell wall biosynthesis